MKIILRTTAAHFRRDLTAAEARTLWRGVRHLDRLCVIVAANWRVHEETGEEGWFEELTADEFDSPFFLEDFANAKFQLSMR